MIISNSSHHGKVGKGRINAYRTLNPSFPNYSAAFRITNGKNHCTGSQTNFEAIAYPGLQYFWYFGDGSTDSTSGYLCQHTFSNAGNFTIKLILKDSVTAAPVAEQTYKNYIFIYDCNPIFSKHGNWYFGEYAGLNFANGYPEPDTTPVFMSEFKTRSGTISISNDSGNIEFYCGYYFNPASIFTNRPIVIGGDHVKQRELGDYFYLGGNQNVAYLSFGDLHYLFLGSNDLFGTPPPLGFYSFSLAQDRTINPLSSLQVVKPNNPNINFQDTTDFEGGILTNQNLITIPSCDSIYWIVTQGFAPNLAHEPLHSSQLLVIKVQMIGGQVHTKLNQAYSLPGSIGTPNLKAYFTSSPDGNFVARINDPVFNSYQSSTDVFKFDKQTGMLEFYKRLRYGAGGGLCFSPSGRFLYVVNGSTLVQYDLSLEHPDDYPTFNELDNNNGCGMLQLGPDGKIYIALIESKVLATINFPDSLNTPENPNACGLNSQWPYLDSRATSFGGLPNFVTSQMVENLDADFDVTTSSCNTGASFFPNIRNCDTLFHWNFGDGDTSIEKFPFHNYEQSGKYIVTLINGNDTVLKEIEVGLIGTIDGVTGICDTSYFYSYSVRNNEYYSYEWSATNGLILSDSTQHEIQTKFPQSSILKVIVRDSRTGCIDSSQVQIISISSSASNILFDTFAYSCFGQTEIHGNVPNFDSTATYFHWQQCVDSINWVDIPGENLFKLNIQIAGDTARFFRRILTIPGCDTIISNSVKREYVNFENTISLDSQPPLKGCHFDVLGNNPVPSGLNVDFTWHYSDFTSNWYQIAYPTHAANLYGREMGHDSLLIFRKMEVVGCHVNSDTLLIKPSARILRGPVDYYSCNYHFIYNVLLDNPEDIDFTVAWYRQKDSDPFTLSAYGEAYSGYDPTYEFYTAVILHPSCYNHVNLDTAKYAYLPDTVVFFANQPNEIEVLVNNSDSLVLKVNETSYLDNNPHYTKKYRWQRSNNQMDYYDVTSHQNYQGNTLLLTDNGICDSLTYYRVIVEDSLFFCLKDTSYSIAIHQLKFNGAHLAPGIYHCTIKLRDDYHNIKLIISR